MTIKQGVIKFIYPLLKKVSGIKSNNAETRVNPGVNSIVPFYSLKATLLNKSIFDFNLLKGKKVMLVNVASNCGFTPQYKELQTLGEAYKSSLVILGFPANDFRGQEPGTDEEIESFCKVNYNISFPLFRKGSVVKPDQQDVFAWLTSKSKNGWNDVDPSWNFCKYLVSENGELIATLKPHISPLNVEVLKLIEEPGTSN